MRLHCRWSQIFTKVRLNTIDRVLALAEVLVTVAMAAVSVVVLAVLVAVLTVTAAVTEAEFTGLTVTARELPTLTKATDPFTVEEATTAAEITDEPFIEVTRAWGGTQAPIFVYGAANHLPWFVGSVIILSATVTSNG